MKHDPARSMNLYSDRGLDGRVVLVVYDLEIFVGIVEDRWGLALDYKLRQRIRRTRELHTDLVQMVGIGVGVADRIDQFADIEIGLLGDHMRQKRILGDVEGCSQEQVIRANIEMARQTTGAYIELKAHMAWWQRHLFGFGSVPC